MSSQDRFAGELPAPQRDLRERVSERLVEHQEIIAADASELIPDSGRGPLDREFYKRLIGSLIQLLALAIRDAAVNERGRLIANLRSDISERSIEISQLFMAAYVVERTALDQLALDESIGATTEAWPVVAQLLRRGSFEYLASFASRSRFDPASALHDPLTTLYTRAVLDAVLLKETERAGRSGDPLALILFDVDRLNDINHRHGYGVGTRILERLGILMRSYFRKHDWVARHGDDEIAVLFTGSDAGHAGELAERARQMVEQRLAFTDHRLENPLPVTVSAAAINTDGVRGVTIDPERLLLAVEAGLRRAKQAGRNRVELVGGGALSRTLPRSSPSA